MEFDGFNNVKIKGSIDVVMAASHHQHISTVRQNILVGIELKKDTDKEDAKIDRQVILQHVAASYLNPDTGILTIMRTAPVRSGPPEPAGRARAVAGR